MSGHSASSFASFEMDVDYGFLDGKVSAPKQHHPKLVLNGPESTVGQALKYELKRASSFTFSVAFVSPGGLALLKQALIDFDGVGQIITSDYLGFNSPRAFAELLALRDLGIDIRRHVDGAFHPKGYIFRTPEAITGILGSSNLTETALSANHEWNIRVTAAHESDLAAQFMNLLDEQATRTVELTDDWVAGYSQTWAPPRSPDIRQPQPGTTITSSTTPIIPNAMQVEALNAIANLRESHAKRGLVISATGTGKTILAALDVKAASPKRVLFVAHREQILDRAATEFRRVLDNGADEYGKVAGSRKELDRKFTFATVQTLSRTDVLAQIRPTDFDYVLIDEVHRAAAPTYLRILDHLKPQFTLGLSATPERTDGQSIFELFDFNVPYEIRLNAALEQNMLAPFHYYGVADITFNDGTTTTDTTPVSRLVAAERVAHITKAIARYGQAGVQPRGLVFCSRKDEAAELSRELNRVMLRGKPLRTIALTGDDDIAERERQVERLENGELDYILTVDIFNEGVDIPSINQVIMLRQTQSSIVFVQQLGRGLRKAPGKEYLVVIDFIGNYANNYLIPIALFGDDSLNKESIRRSLIAAEERGVVAGLSSIQFDRIAQERVLRSLATTRLDSLQNLKPAIETVRNRVGRTPRLQDYLHFESVDPVVLATRLGNYPALLEKLFQIEHNLGRVELDLLTVLSNEVLSAKRLHEAVLLRALIDKGEIAEDKLPDVFSASKLPASSYQVDSAMRTLTLEFNTQQETTTYRHARLSEATDSGTVRLSEGFRGALAASSKFHDEVEDILNTTSRIIIDRYAIDEPFTPARQYSRKDAPATRMALKHVVHHLRLPSRQGNRDLPHFRDPAQVRRRLCQHRIRRLLDRLLHNAVVHAEQTDSRQW